MSSVEGATRDRRWARWLLTAVVVLAVLDPGGEIVPFAKYGLAALLAACGAVVALLGRPTPWSTRHSWAVVAYVAAFAVLLPGYGAAVHFVRADFIGGDWLVYAGPCLFLVLLGAAALTCLTTADLERAVVRVLTLLALVVWALFVAGFVVDPGFINTWGSRLEVLTFTTRQYGGFTLPVVYYYTSPMLVVAAAYWEARARRTGAASASVWFGLVVGALLLSGTRANQVAAVVLVAWYVGRRSRLALAVAATAVTAVGVWFLPTLTAPSGVPGTSSNRVKLAYLDEYTVMFDDPWSLLFGHGLGSCVLRFDSGTCLTVTELTYLDLVRVFGVIGALAYAALLALPLLGNAWGRRPYLTLGLGLYLVVAAVNPYLFSTNGMVVLTLALVSAADRVARPAEPRPVDIRPVVTRT